ncbi:hypothetical protein AAMO2058_000462600 [Amorphochlora amoebiformis]
MASFKVVVVDVRDGSKLTATLKNAEDYSSLVSDANSILKGMKKGFRFKYRDEDGDLVTIGSGRELAFALQMVPQPELLVEEAEGMLIEEESQVTLAPEAAEPESQPVSTFVKVLAQPIEAPIVVAVDASYTVSSEEEPIISVEPESPKVVLVEKDEKNGTDDRTEVKSVDNSSEPLVVEKTEQSTQATCPTEEKGNQTQAIDMPFLKLMGEKFIQHPEFMKILSQNMEDIIVALTTEGPERCLEILKEKVDKVSVLREHPFYCVLAPQFRSLKTVIATQMSAISSTALVMLSSLQSTNANTEAPRKDLMCHEKEKAAVSRQKVVPVKKVIGDKKAKPQLVADKEAKAQFVAVLDGKATDETKQLHAQAAEDGYVLSIGIGKDIKWRFEEGIPIIKYFKTSPPPNLQPGYRLVRINNSWIQGLCRPEVEATWIRENAGSKTTRLYFQSPDHLHPCEKYHDDLEKLQKMAFPVKRARELLNLHGGNFHQTLDTLLSTA